MSHICENCNQECWCDDSDDSDAIQPQPQDCIHLREAFTACPAGQAEAGEEGEGG